MIIGLDIGKEKLAFAILDKNKTIKKGFISTKNKNKLLKLIEKYKINKVVLEHTGIYSLMIHKYIQDTYKDLKIFYLNSSSSDQLRKLFFKSKKEDLIDAEIIAKSIYFEEVLNSFKIDNLVVEIMHLVRQHKKVTKVLSEIKQMIGSDKEFGLNYDKLEEIKNKIEDAKKEIEKEIKLLLKGTKYEKIIKKVDGINYVSMAYFIYYVKDIKRFPTVWKFLAYCGVAPITYSSGKFNVSRTTSRINKELKRILYMAAVGLLRNPRYREIYDKKIKEGKHHFVAISHIAKRIVKNLYREWNITVA